MKVIGVVGRVYFNKDNQEVIQLNDYLRQILNLYDDVVVKIILPTNKNSYLDIGMGNDKLDDIDKKKLDYILNECDAFVLPGGSSWYLYDEYVIEYALKSNKPLLGICAGFQAICSYFAKDRIRFDMTSKILNDNHYGSKDEYKHSVSLNDKTILKSILVSDKIMVNSLHHDCVNFIFNDLKVSAVSDDNIIEAVEYSNHKFFIGVQWHPEYLFDDNSRVLFDYFIKVI